MFGEPPPELHELAVTPVLALLEEDLVRRDLRQPPPTGTLRREPPLVQYLRQPLQK